MSYRKSKDPEYIRPKHMAETIGTRKPKDTPMLEKFENTIRQYTNDYISYQISAHNREGTNWYPGMDSAYLCYTWIMKKINNITYDGDRRFKEWLIKEPISNIRQIIFQEMVLYRKNKKP